MFGPGPIGFGTWIPEYYSTVEHFQIRVFYNRGFEPSNVSY